ncbi:histone-lysine N-methyltransferase NSD2-like isoform X2 [Dreissena polymorpha]|uniref:histone-lysine N-methyltransferase NSD2-like isoform X2 n=1 Tax=Dreissena polymorpha TaxID=45954 RepID=UPI00226476B3|nr:histone-lysine N-methyltransferase NSD2-like isoform X2 [Dreissena polymorpha]
MENASKLVNGSDAPATGFRHALPQIAAMSRHPKIAQSKTASSDPLPIGQSTTEVEGVGKVFHIGSELMEVDTSPEKNLLEQLENNTSPATEVPPEIKENHNSKDIKDDTKNTHGLNGATSDVNLETTNSEVSSKESRSRGRKSNTLKKETPAKSPASKSSNESSRESSKKRKPVDANTTPVTVETPISDASSPSKRQRKPKKFEDETEPQKPQKSAEKTPTKAKPAVVVDAELEAKYPVKWLVGDLVWAKVPTHPWWPCMISYDPFTSVHTKANPKRGREYHVQFFGDAAERGWIPSSNLLEFLGREKFDEYVKGLLENAKSPKDLERLKKWYEVKPHRKKAVDKGIQHCETALPLSLNERKAQFTFTYQIPKLNKKDVNLQDIDEDVKKIKEADVEGTLETKPAKKRKHSEVVTPEKTKSASKKRKIETETEKEQTESPVVSIGKKTSVSKIKLDSEGSFDVFCQKERDNVLAEHPEFSDEMLMDYCKQQWCMMSKKQKARYKSKYNDESDASQEMSPSRQRRPSKKVKEAEEDNKLVDEVLSGKKAATPTVSKAKVASPPSKSTPTASRAKVASPKAATPTVSRAKVASPTASPSHSKKRGRPRKSEVSDQVQKENLDCGTPKATKESTKVNTNKDLKPVKEPEPVKETAVKTEPDSEMGGEVKTEPISVIPAKRAKPKKSATSDSTSDNASESGRSTPTLVTEPLAAPRKEKEEFEYEMEITKLSSAGPQRKENLCQICEQTGELLECTGPCQGFFHTDCLGIARTPEGEFKCDECTNGTHSCFVCKKSDGSTQRCSVTVCGKFYHPDCLKEFPQAKQEGKGLMCPLHSCHTCLANKLKASANKTNGRLLRCVRCPTAYHVGDFCIAAGSINLTGLNIVCAKHFQPIPSMKHHTHVNVGWCFSCNKGGTLLCCESCPAAYHAECLNIEFPTGSWYCHDCVVGKRPLYGDIIWVKLGNYRWWPGEVCHPRNVPMNIQDKPHQVGEFPVHFLGSHEYFWLHQGRVFSFQDGDKGATGSSSNKGLAKHFQKGLKEATEAYKVVKEFRENREQLEIAKESKKPAPFKMVKTNIPLGSVTIKKADLSELPSCECKPDDDKPCGRDSECLNAMMMYECHPALCPAGENCHNQFFTKRLYPPQQSYKTEARGWGLKAMADIRKGEFVNEYVGDLIDEEECKRRLEKAHEDNVHNFYMMTLDMDRIIDAGPKGNLSRFMNHSCDPNLETQKWNVNGDVRVGLFALRDIKEGEELTFNYNFDCLGNEQTKCQCGAENCSGFLGVRPKTQHAAQAEMKKNNAKMTKLKKKKKAEIQRKHDDDCFRCGEGGELVMCDRSSCTKSYHLRCLGLSKPPYGKWDCPWHHCDQCGKPAIQMCVECPNSFCVTHAENQTREFDGRMYCNEHEELLETLIESQSQGSTASEEEEPANKKTVGKNGKTNGNGAKTKVKKENGGEKKSQETLPPKKRGPKPVVTEDKDEKTGNGKSQNGRRSSVKGDPVLDETLALAPMFDDDDDEEFGLVIDIPTF